MVICISPVTQPLWIDVLRRIKRWDVILTPVPGHTDWYSVEITAGRGSLGGPIEINANVETAIVKRFCAPSQFPDTTVIDGVLFP